VKRQIYNIAILIFNAYSGEVWPDVKKTAGESGG
jgi:hypothetical protein